MDWLVNFLDLLITCCSTQSQFVADIFKEGEFTQIFLDDLIKKQFRQQLLNKGDLNPALKALLSSIDSRIVILLSEMAHHKVHNAFLQKLSEGGDDMHMRLFDTLIRPLLL
jgi:hypothetical protein